LVKFDGLINGKIALWEKGQDLGVLGLAKGEGFFQVGEGFHPSGENPTFPPFSRAF